MSESWALRVAQESASDAPATVAEALDSLARLANEIRAHLSVDRAKIYLVRRSAAGPLVWRVTSQTPGESDPVLYNPRRGLADYVIRESTYLLIPSRETPSTAGDDKLRLEGLNGRGEWVEVIARPDSEMGGGPTSRGSHESADSEDNEATLLYVPVFAGSQVSAVIGVSRNHTADGRPVRELEIDDARLLGDAAPTVATVSQRYLHLAKAEEHLNETRNLGQALAGALSLREGYEAVSRSVGKLARTKASILFEYRAAEASGYLFQIGSWSTNATGPSPRTLIFPCGADPASWQEQIREALKAALEPLQLRCRRLMVATTQEGSFHRAMAICDATLDFEEPSYFSDRLLEHYTDSFFEAACGALDAFKDQLASRFIDRLTGPPQDPSKSQEALVEHPTRELLRSTAELLSAGTGAGAVLVYGGTNQARVLASVPASDSVEWPPVHTNSRTGKVLHDARGYWVLDARIEDHELDSALLTELANLLNWPEGIGSWQVVPVLHDGQIVGLLKLLSEQGERYLGKDHFDIAERIARQAGWEVHRELRRSAVERLNFRLNELGAIEGEELGLRLIKELREWAQATFLRPNCEVVLWARSLRSGTLARAATISIDFEDPSSELRVFSKIAHWGGPTSAPCPCLAIGGKSGVSAPIVASGDRRLQGFLALVDERRFNPSEGEVLEEAARFLAVFLQAERERNDVRLDMGLFRHAALGAVQGLTSNALVLADLAMAAGGDDADIAPLRRRVLYESAQLRLWRENQRFYLTGSSPRFKRNPQALRPILERSFERYRTFADHRNITYNLDLPEGKGLTAAVDEGALDVALSNLLDNAVKYCYQGREVTLGMRATRKGVEIWVEDVGHPIPEQFQNQIFERGLRKVGSDPFRAIVGQGLGLFLVKRIVEGHDGEIEVRSDQEGAGPITDTTPHRVRLTIRLPFGGSLS